MVMFGSSPSQRAARDMDFADPSRPTHQVVMRGVWAGGSGTKCVVGVT
ncbi:Uncharacterised protein [Mycobacteroides abscessus subsp. abscessus]|nr:Uncharacterised protein [Mycobacteroides abscessus subsp. abscessus]